MSVEATLGGTVVGLEAPAALALAPVAVVAVAALVFYRADGTAGRRSRILLFAARATVALLVVAAVAGPYTVATRETTGDPRVTLLVDESESMAVLGSADGLAEDVEEQGVPTTVSTVGNGTRSRLGDGVAANLRENGSVVVVSDGRVTAGRSLAEAGELARSLNATVSRVDLDPRATERHVSLAGPSKTSAGVESRFLVSVGGVEADGTVDVTVEVDGDPVHTGTVNGSGGAVEVTHVFNDTGPHRVTARIDSPDRYRVNDVAYRTVRVVERPRILYVSGGEYPLRDYLGRLYEVDTARSVPADLSPYYAVVVQNVPADGVGNVSALQEFVIDGGGLVAVGGDSSFERGGYGGTSFASMLPVTTGETGPGTSRLVLAIDVSGSTAEGMRVQKAIALDVLDQLGDENEVGIVAFNYQAYAVAEPRPLGESRGTLTDRIRRLQSGGATDITAGLRGAGEMLGDQRGTVILISDGVDDSASVATAANSLGRRGIPVIAVGVGERTNERRLRTIAQESGGTFLRAGETERLRLRFGGASRSFEGSGLTVVDPNTFVTAGVRLTSNPGRTNDVSVKRGADLLVAGPSGDPAVARWRYGLGRVLTITAFDDGSTLDGLLQRPDSLLVTRSVNYAIGDPERKAAGVMEAADTRVGEPTTLVYRGSSRPAVDGATFRQVGPDRYEATVTPRSQGFHVVGSAEYAANYPAEYAGFGQSDALSRLVRSTGGRTFEPSEAAAIARFAREQSTAVREVRDEWDWLALLAAFLVFFGEVAVRRVQVYRGRTRLESGLP
ncbi:MAG: VWA domain-containing protein [Haloferacaceae archaeon]